MSDSQKLDLILIKIGNMEKDISELKQDVSILKDDLKNFKIEMGEKIQEFKEMDMFIIDEVQRVHGILNRHTRDKLIHMA